MNDEVGSSKTLPRAVKMFEQDTATGTGIYAYGV